MSDQLKGTEMFSEYKNQHGNPSYIDVNEIVGVGTMNKATGEIQHVTLIMHNGSWLMTDFHDTNMARVWLESERQRLAAPWGRVVSLTSDEGPLNAVARSEYDALGKKLEERDAEINTLRDAMETWKSTAQSEACVNQTLREENAKLAKAAQQTKGRKYYPVIARRSTGIVSFDEPKWIDLNVQTIEIVEHSLSKLDDNAGCVVMTSGGYVYFVLGYSASELQALKRESVGK